MVEGGGEAREGVVGGSASERCRVVGVGRESAAHRVEEVVLRIEDAQDTDGGSGGGGRGAGLRRTVPYVRGPAVLQSGLGLQLRPVVVVVAAVAAVVGVRGGCSICLPLLLLPTLRWAVVVRPAPSLPRRRSLRRVDFCG